MISYRSALSFRKVHYCNTILCYYNFEPFAIHDYMYIKNTPCLEEILILIRPVVV